VTHVFVRWVHCRVLGLVCSFSEVQVQLGQACLGHVCDCAGWLPGMSCLTQVHFRCAVASAQQLGGPGAVVLGMSVTCVRLC
jgi:hypothetical protein